MGQDQAAALGAGLQDVVTHLGIWVEGAGEVQGGAVPYLCQLTEGGLLDTAYRQESSGLQCLGGPWGAVTAAGSSMERRPIGTLLGRADAQDT